MIGLLLEGKPVDSDGFIRVCRHYGCPAPVAKDILKELLRTGRRKVTVADDVGSGHLRVSLSQLGLQVVTIPPK